MVALRTAACCAGVSLALCVASAQVKAAPLAKAPVSASPSGTCDFTHRMDIEVIDGVWFECMCLALAIGWDCDWVQLPEPAVIQIRRVLKRRHLALRAYMPRRLVFA